jgi:hypothetical protein
LEFGLPSPAMAPRSSSGCSAAGIDPNQLGQLVQRAQQQAAAPDPVTQLEKLAKLKESGALTEAEFEAEKAKILGQ